MGDVDSNNKIEILDSTAIQTYAAELDALDDVALFAADVNGDGNVNIFDATCIQLHCAELSEATDIGTYKKYFAA